MSNTAGAIVLSVLAGTLLATGRAAQPENEKKDDTEQPIKMKRRDSSSAEDLRKQLQSTPEVGFDQTAAAVVLGMLRRFDESSQPKGGGNFTPGVAPPNDLGPRYYNQVATALKRPDLLALPWRAGQDAQLGKEAAEVLHVYSARLRLSMREAVPMEDVRPDADSLKKILDGDAPVSKAFPNRKPLEWGKSGCVPTLAQMLQTENTPLRMLMVEMLAKVDGKEAGIVLAQRAVFDVSPEVREKAIGTLRKRPSKEYQQFLIDALRWPWQPVADHAAEAMVALEMKDAVPKLIEMLKEPDPKLPFTVEEGKKKATYVKEVVRINHMANCLLCHAPSMAKEDLVRGRIPVPGQNPPPLYYADSTGEFVRAEITFLKQDFSLIQPVANPGKWPGQQRFDYMLRTRKATPAEVKLLQGLEKEKKKPEPYPQRDAILFGLRELTGKDYGSRTESWLPLLDPLEKKTEPSKEK